MPEVADTFFSNAINGIERIARAEGYHVIIYLTHESREREESILQELRGGRVDGILMSVSQGVESNSIISTLNWRRSFRLSSLTAHATAWRPRGC